MPDIESQKPPELIEDLPPEFEGVYNEHAQPIYYFLLRSLGDPTLAEDALHDVFLKAFKNLHRFRADSKIRTWLYRIAINHCKNLFRTWHHRRIQYEPEIAEHLSGPDHNHPLRVLEIKELGTRIQETLEKLPEENRALLLMVADDRLSYEDIGELTDQSADAVRGKLYRARKAFTALFNRTSEISKR